MPTYSKWHRRHKEIYKAPMPAHRLRKPLAEMQIYSARWTDQFHLHKKTPKLGKPSVIVSLLHCDVPRQSNTCYCHS